MYIHCRKVHAEFNKLMKQYVTVFFVENTHLCQEFRLYLGSFILLLNTSLSCNETLKSKVCKFHVFIRCHCTKSSHEMCFN